MSWQDTYASLGYALVSDAVPQNLLDTIRSHADQVGAKFPNIEEQNSLNFVTDGTFHDIVKSECFMELIRPLLGEDLLHFYSRYFQKPPHTDSSIPFHQDGGNDYSLDPNEFVTLWIALDDASLANGCMLVIPGTHRGQLLPVEPLPANYWRISQAAVQAEVPATSHVPLEVQAGDVVLMHPKLVHGSGPNRSGTWRRALAIRYINVTTRILRKLQFGVEWGCAFLVHGSSQGCRNVLINSPP
jgi:phytanoyl-CoA hydroxylase